MDTAVVAIIEKEGKILVGKRVNDGKFLSGKWHIPGGMVERGESAEEGLKREMMEELSCNLYDIQFLEEQLKEELHVRVKWYTCSIGDQKPVAGSDLEAVQFI